MELKECPNCNKKLKEFMSTKVIVDDKSINFINTFNNTKSQAYCTGCAPDLIYKYVNDVKLEIEDLRLEVKKQIEILPIITVNNPKNWEYEIIEMVTAQSVIGTGFFTEISSSWSDLLGTQSNSLNSKVSEGEINCKNELRYKAIMLGGNAIIGTDIDYAEVGGVKAMIMVCMSGTAINITNQATVFKDNSRMLISVKEMLERIKLLSNLTYTVY